ncbi:hypothetical protein LF1_55720 [Rubripirellula obstinata]|uniref:Uncharacterized protein n=1 Tax=Rubripirellula obstinata TaxID=406547 RepID=A0A5B1CA72_9BACT|nr:hypothetical protein LF1_55720 [Rubripirellula obstinata]
MIGQHSCCIWAGGVPPLFSRTGFMLDGGWRRSVVVFRSRGLCSLAVRLAYMLTDNHGMHRSGACTRFLMVAFSVPTR